MRTYGARTGSVEVVPHGVPNLPLVDPETVKPRLGLEGRHLLLSFGLMNPGKGYEAAIEAMRAVVDADATALYVILGATRIDLLGTEGEAYRERLVAMVGRLGLGDHVRFENRFVGRVELARWVEAADIVLAPYNDPDRLASGTISYAMSAGRAVIASPSTYAKTRLSRGRGLVLADSSPGAISAAVLRLPGESADPRGLRSQGLGGHARGDLVRGRGRLLIMGSGETAPAMAKVHRALFDRFEDGPVPAVILDTPYGFQENADELSSRTMAFFETSVGNPVEVASLRTRDVGALAEATALARIREARYVMAGQGSPSYALSQWMGGPIPDALAEKASDGGILAMASAAALTMGVVTIPVYEIYKVGEDPRWLEGLDLLGRATGLRAAVVPHYDRSWKPCCRRTCSCSAWTATRR